MTAAQLPGSTVGAVTVGAQSRIQRSLAGHKAWRGTGFSAHAVRCTPAVRIEAAPLDGDLLDSI